MVHRHPATTQAGQTQPSASLRQHRKSDGRDYDVLMQEARQFVALSRRVSDPTKLKRHIAHLTTFIIQLQPEPEPSQQAAADKICLLLLRNALSCIQRLIDVGAPFRQSNLAALMTAATRTIRDRKALFEAVLSFVRTIHPIAPSSSIATSIPSSSSDPARPGPNSATLFTQRILPSLITAFGKAGLPHLGEQLIQESTSNPATHTQLLSRYMASISTHAPQRGQRKDQPPDPLGGKYTGPTLAALHAYDTLLVAERRRKACLEPPLDPSIPALPDIAQIRLGAWSAQPDVWAALVGARLSVGDENGAEVWLSIYRSLIHHKRWRALVDRPNDLDDDADGEGEGGPMVSTYLPDPSPRPYLLRAQTRVSHGKRLRYVRQKTKAALRKDPELVAPYQTSVVREQMRFLNRDGVVPDLVTHNFLIGFEAGCERLPNALVLVEQTLRAAALSLRSDPARDDDRNAVVEEEEEEEDKERSIRLLHALGPGFLANVAEIHLRRSKMLLRLESDGAGENAIERRKLFNKTAAGFTQARHPIASYFCGITAGDSLALWLELLEQPGRGGLGAGAASTVAMGEVGDGDGDGEEGAEWQARDGEELEEDEHEDGGEEDVDVEVNWQEEEERILNEEDESESDNTRLEASPNHSPNSPPLPTQAQAQATWSLTHPEHRRLPMRLSAWTRRYLSSLLSAPTYEYPHALLLLEQLSSRRSGMFAVSQPLVTDVLAGLMRAGHTHVLRHMGEKERVEEGRGRGLGGEGSSTVTFVEESSEEESVTVVTMERRSLDSSETKKQEDPRSRSSNPTVQNALRSSANTALISQLLSSAILAEIKYTVANYLDVIAQRSGAGAGGGDEGAEERMLADGQAFHAALGGGAVSTHQTGTRTGTKEEEDDDDGSVPTIGVEWVRNLILDRTPEVGAPIRTLSYRLLMNEGLLESRIQQHRGGSPLPPWDEEARAQLMQIVLGWTRERVRERREALRAPWPVELVEELERERRGPAWTHIIVNGRGR
ncbi:unnamed protein product [Tilletia controversa]|nr:unnamed protein product [Tilletia controversa]CAD6981761.1 unnamed protein product [Tilletia controversa]